MPDIFTAQPKDKKATTEETAKIAMEKAHVISNENHIHSLSSFCINSNIFSFHSQDADEKIILFLRRHFITNIGWFFLTFVFLIIPPFLLFFGNSLFELINLDLPARLITLIIIFYYMLLFIYALLNFLDWFYNVTIITEKRVVDVDYYGLVYHNVAITKLTQIEDVNYTKIGFLRSIFNYGDVYAQTAGGVSDHFDMLAIPQPEKIANFISDLIGVKYAR